MGKMFWHDRVLKRYMKSRGFQTSIDILTKNDVPIRIVLFENIKHYQKTASYSKAKDTIATYYPPPTESDNTKCLGIMVFCVDKIGAGIVTHEMYHFGEHLQRLDWSSEEIADTLQNATISFWNWFYQVPDLDYNE